MGEACLCNHVPTKRKEDEVLALFTPLKLGPYQLCHRIVLAPLTRCRSPRNVPQPEPMSLYYSQRTTRGGLLISEGTVISDTAVGFPDTPGIWSQEQVEAWKPIVKAVHDKKGIFFCQIWHLGRMSAAAFQPNGIKPVSSTNIKVKGQTPGLHFDLIDFTEPRQLETDEIPSIVNDFGVAAKNAIAAGFDGVEIHGAHGYIIDQFLKDGVNHRTDKYGGSIENRCRFTLEVVDKVVAAVGAEKVGLRLSPFADYGNAHDSDPVKLVLYLIGELNKRKLTYIHLVEPRMKIDTPASPDESLLPFKKAWHGVFLAAGGFGREDGIKAVESGEADAIAYGRHFLANPDLPRRFRLNAPLNHYLRETFYSSETVKGYTDYPCLQESHPE